MASPTRRRFESFAEQAGNFVRRNQGAEFDRTPRGAVLEPRQDRVRQIVAPIPGLGGIIGLRTMDGRANLSTFGQPESLDVTHPVRLRFEGPVPGIGIKTVETHQEKALVIDDPRQRRREDIRELGRYDQELLEVSDPRQTRREGTELFSVGQRLSTKEDAAKAFLAEIFRDPEGGRKAFILLVNSAWITRTFLKKSAALLGAMNEFEKTKAEKGEEADLVKEDPVTGISFTEARKEFVKLFDKSSDTLLSETINFAGHRFSLDTLRLVVPQVAASEGIRLITRDITIKNRKTGETDIKEIDNIGAVRGITKEEPVAEFVIDFTGTHIMTDSEIMKSLDGQLRELVGTGGRVAGLAVAPLLVPALAGLAFTIIGFFKLVFVSKFVLGAAVFSFISWMTGIGFVQPVVVPVIRAFVGKDVQEQSPVVGPKGELHWRPPSPLAKALPFFAGFGVLVVGGLAINALA